MVPQDLTETRTQVLSSTLGIFQFLCFPQQISRDLSLTLLSEG